MIKVWDVEHVILNLMLSDVDWISIQDQSAVPRNEEGRKMIIMNRYVFIRLNIF